MITSLDHVQLAIPAGAEAVMRPFYVLLGFEEVAKPAPLAGRGGFWMQAGTVQVHFGVDPNFAAATKAHPAFRVSGIDALAQQLDDAGYPVVWDDALPEVKRFFVSDPVGNRIEIMAD